MKMSKKMISAMLAAARKGGYIQSRRLAVKG